MRSIIFRAKALASGRWVYGDLIQLGDRSAIHCYERGCPVSHEVDVLTVGQYSAVDDKNGNQIFEGDLIRIEEEPQKLYEVKFKLGQFFIGINMPIAYRRFSCEVVGNIYDNDQRCKL